MILKNTLLSINGSQIFANAVSLDSSATVSPVYKEGQRHSFDYLSAGPNVNTLSFSYYLTGVDPLKNYLSQDDVFLTGKISNFSFNSGCLTNYSCRFSPNNPVEINATINVYDYFSGSISSESTNKRIVPLNSSNLLINNLTSGSIDLGNFESASFDYSVDVSPVYHIETGIGKINLTPDRIAWGRKQIKMSFNSDSIDPYITLNGQSASIRIEARNTENSALEVFSVSGKIIKKSISIQQDSPIAQSYEVIQNRVESSPVITSFSPINGTAGDFISVFGSNFNNISSLFLGEDQINEYYVTSSSSLSFKIPTTVNSGFIKINSFEDSAFSSSGIFLTYSPITISSFSPLNVSSGKTTLIYGTNFNKVSSVLFNGTSGNFIVLSDSSIQAIAPGRILNGPISVISSSRNSSAQSLVDYFSSPVIDGFAPKSGVPGDTVSVTGANFKNLDYVRVNGVGASYSIVNTGILTFTVPTGNSWGTLKVGNTASQYAETSYKFTPQVLITGNWPRSGIAYSAHSISGINFQTGLLYEILPNQYKVSFNGTTTGFYLQNQNKLTGLIPRGADTGPVYIYKSDGVSTYNSTGNFIYIDDSPTILKAFPSGLISGDSLNINIIGENLSNLIKVNLTGSSSSLSTSGKSITLWDKNYNIHSIPVDADNLRTLRTNWTSDYFGSAANIANQFSHPTSLTGNGFITGQAISTGAWYLSAENVGGTGNTFGPIYIKELPKISHLDTTRLILSSASSTTDPLQNAAIFALDGNTSTYAQTSQLATTGTFTFAFNQDYQIHRVKVTTYDQPYTNDGANPRYLKFILGSGNNHVAIYSGNAQVSSYSTYTSGYGVNTGTLSWRHEARAVQIQSHYFIAGVEQILPLRLAEVEIYGIPIYR